MTYYEKLKDPRWQKKRLEVLERANFTCASCYDKDSELHIHHVYYEKGKDPWDYPSSHLWCLCKNCHESLQKNTTDILKLIADRGPDFTPWLLFGEFFNLLNPFLEENELGKSLIILIKKSAIYYNCQDKNTLKIIKSLIKKLS